MTSRVRLLLNADVRTTNRTQSVAEAVAWKDGRILAVGSAAEVTEQTPGAEVIDAAGATVLPGFIDAHQHPFVVALYGGLLHLSPPAVTDIPSLQRVLATAAKDSPSERWLVATDWDEELLAERRPPTRKELDDAVPDRPVLALHYSCHRAVANSRALELARIDRHTAQPSGGRIEPSGLLVERGMSRVETLARASLRAHDPDGFIRRLGEHHSALLATGITRVVDAAMPVDLEPLYREAGRRGALRVPTILMRASANGWLEPPLDALDREAFADDLVTLGPMKLIFDGAPVCAMCLGWLQTAGSLLSTWALAFRRRDLGPVRAAMSLAPRIGRQIRTGIAIYEHDEARSMVKRVTDAGFPVAIHAIGNAAIDTALAALEATGNRHGISRIEHATFLDRELVKRIAGAGAAVVAQPYFTSLPAFDSAPSIPGLSSMPLRWLLDAGVRVAGSSDHPVVGFAPLDGIRAAVNRRTSSGRVYEGEQCVTVDEAVTMFTRTAAEVSGCLDECGTIEVGKRADLIVLDRSLRELDGVQVRMTILGGETAFSSG